MNILFLISQIPYPPDTGAKIRSFNLIKQLSFKHKITVMAFGDDVKEAFKIGALRPYCKNIIVVPRKATMKYLSMFLNIFSTLPYTVKKYHTGAIEKRLMELAFNGRFDLIHCDSLQMSLNLRRTNTIPKVLTEHNVESAILERYSQNEPNIFKKIYVGIQSNKLARYEFDTCRRFNKCIAVSENDSNLIQKHSGISNISVVPNGVDCSYFTPQKGFVKPFSLVFTGSLDWLPNEDALMYFFSDIYPLLKKKVPHVNITIVGRNPSSKLKKIASKDSSIALRGRVDDVRSYIAQNQIVIVPLRIGGGTRLKILEAMAMGKPVVSTTIGAEGLGVANDENILLADNPENFTKRIVYLFENIKKMESLAIAGRKLVEEKYDWGKVAQDLDKAWGEAAGIEIASAPGAPRNDGVFK